MNKPAVMLSILFCAAIVWSAQADFERYKIIIDKQPFGSEPPGAEIVQVQPSKSFARSLRLSMLFEGPDGQMRAGITDSQSKKSYILAIGESEGGIELVEADINSSEAQLRKGNEIALLKLSGSSEPATTAKKSPPSYAERRRTLLKKIGERRKETQQTPKGPQLTGEALRKHLESVQMDAIRTGKPPLPIPLTPAMDEKLVQEGVLPPQ